MPSNSANKPAISLVKSDDETAEPISRDKQLASRVVADVCLDCFGTGMKVEAGKGARICDCSKQDPKRTLWDAARIPSRYSYCTLDSFKCKENTSQYIALEYAKCLVRDYPYIDRGLIFMGPVGVGKTHLAVAILQGLMQRGVACLFYEFGHLLKEIRDSYSTISNSSELSVLAPVYQAEVLVLDELGASIPTDWVKETLYQVINTRYNDKKLTIATTNRYDEAFLLRAEAKSQADASTSWTAHRGNEDKRARAQTVKSLEERIGFPLRSRLYEMCNTVLIEGEDYRKRSDKRRL